MKQFLDSTVKYIPLIIGIYIITSMFRAYFYYFPFGIEIYSFVELNEIFTIWLTDTTWIFFALLFPLLMLSIFVPLELKHQGYIYRHWIPFIAFASIHGYILYRIINATISKTDPFMLYSQILTFSLILALLTSWFFLDGVAFLIRNYRKVKKKETRIPKFNGYVMILSITITCFLGSIYIQLDNSFNSGFEPKRIHLIFNDDKVISTDDNYIYLGRTNKYIFLFNKSEGVSSVFNNEDIKNMLISSETSIKLFNDPPTTQKK